MSRLRGFEKVSFEQFKKDMVEEFYNDDNVFLTSLYDGIKMPERATAYSSGYDIYSPIDFKLSPNEEIKLPTGIKAYMAGDEWLIIMPRSSLGFKYYTRLANTIGNGDSDYYNNIKNEGHYWVKIRNEGTKELLISKGNAIAQCVFSKYLIVDGDNFYGQERVGGIGSTDK